MYMGLVSFASAKFVINYPAETFQSYPAIGFAWTVHRRWRHVTAVSVPTGRLRVRKCPMQLTNTTDRVRIFTFALTSALSYARIAADYSALTHLLHIQCTEPVALKIRYCIIPLQHCFGVNLNIIHHFSRKFPGHRVKSISLSTFTNEEVQNIESSGGNEAARNLWLYNYRGAKDHPEVFRTPARKQWTQ